MATISNSFIFVCGCCRYGQALGSYIQFFFLLCSGTQMINACVKIHHDAITLIYINPLRNLGLLILEGQPKLQVYTQQNPTTHYCQYHRVICVITQKLLLPTRLNDPSENQIKWNPSVSPCSNITDKGVREFHQVVQNSDSSSCNNQFLNPNLGVHKSWWSLVMCH